jgi:hypothetical protein
VIPQLEAVKAALPGTWSVHLLTVPGATATAVPALPYVVLEGPGWGIPEEVADAGPAEELDVDLRVKVVGKSAAQVVTMLDIARRNLSPGGQLTLVPMDDHMLETKYLRSEFVAADTSVTVLQSNTHPVVGVDSYRLTSQPIPA